MVGDEVTGKIIERVRARQRLASLNAWDRWQAENAEEVRQRQAEKMLACKKRYEEMLADPRYDWVYMHPITGAVMYTECEVVKPWWKFWE